MRLVKICVVLAFTILSGCAVKIIPEQVASGSINLKENSQTIERENVSVTVAPAETEMINYNIAGMIASFNIIIQNNGQNELAFDNDSFILLDADKRQYYSLTPEKIKQMLAKDTYYLLPYPYVGFYYLEDYERAAFINSTSTNLPYYYELYPQDLYTRALPTEPIIPGATVKGLLYFHADIHSFPSFSINVYRKGASKSAVPDFIFPFKVVK